MGYVHIHHGQGMTIDNFREVSAKHKAPQDIDGLLAWAAGSDENGLHVVTMWESKAYADRFQAEELFPAFQAAGMPADIPASSEFSTFDTGELYLR